MTVPADHFKDAARRFASGVTLVTVATGDIPHGMTASAFSSVSLEPPVVLVCLEKTSQTRAMVTEAGTFVVNVLAADQEHIAREFSLPGMKSFTDHIHREGIDGAPVIDGAIAWFECRVTDVVDGGDHDVFLGNVIDCGAHPGEPLLYYDRKYRSLHDQ
ncbi:MAG: flavin reductase [Actinobacteria bacterium]|nr:flavin reductase [Actinomycetota bacterium]